jgi:acetylornithine deacetylase/succinyl-diaminopimelate desuccinylase-like protein
VTQDAATAGERDRVRRAVFARLAGYDLTAAVSALVATPSPNPPGRESGVARTLTALVQQWGLTAEADSVAAGRDNVRVGLQPRDGHDQGAALDILFAGHLDTVPADPANWTVDPFGGTVADGAVWGRGSVDMKGGAHKGALRLEVTVRGRAAHGARPELGVNAVTAAA